MAPYVPIGVDPSGRFVFAAPEPESEVLWEWPAGTVLAGGYRLDCAYRVVSHGGFASLQASYGVEGNKDEPTCGDIGPADDTGIAEELAADLARRLRAAGLVPERPDHLEP